MSRPYRIDGPAEPQTPVILSVPHAGRAYPAALAESSRWPREQLEILEDRHADLLAHDAAAAGFTVLAATRARAWIDLNRHEREVDPDMIADAPRGHGYIRSAKVTGGLGLVPRRLRALGDIHARRLDHREVAARIAADHRPYHEQLAALLASARNRFGIAVLLDLHSMPPLTEPGGMPARIVIGDRFGRSAAGRFTAALRETAEAGGWRVALNSPYAGGHILDTHGAPARRVHAVQIEIDRSLYLDAELREPGPGLSRTRALVGDLARAIADEAFGSASTIAAE